MRTLYQSGNWFATIRVINNFGRAYFKGTTTNYARNLSSNSRLDGCGHQTTKYYGQQKDIKIMSDLFPTIVDDLASDKDVFWTPEITDRFKKVITYNVPDNKKVRALLFIEIYKALMSKRNISNEDLRLMYLMAWCSEINQAACIIADDILDNSPVRRHRPTWHVVTEQQDGKVELICYDWNILYEMVYLLLKKYYSSQPYYRAVVESYNSASMNCLLGITLDTIIHKRIDQFDEKLFVTIAVNKTSYLMFILNFQLAFHMAGVYNDQAWEQIENIARQMGIYHQIRNDYHGYVDHIKGGKPEEDIQMGHCSWFVVQALKRANQEQREILKKHYGLPGMEHVSEVRRLYEQLNLQSLYTDCTDRTYRSLYEQITKIPDELARNAVLKALQVTFGFAEQTFEKP